MLWGLVVLLACQAAGEAIVTVTGLSVPGSVIGMLLLFTWLQWRRPDTSPRSEVGTVRVADVLLRHMQLLFVPPAVGIVAYLDTLRADALPIGVAVVGSWVLGLATVALLTALFDRDHEVDAAGAAGAPADVGDAGTMPEGGSAGAGAS